MVGRVLVFLPATTIPCSFWKPYPTTSEGLGAGLYHSPQSPLPHPLDVILKNIQAGAEATLGLGSLLLIRGPGQPSSAR